MKTKFIDFPSRIILQKKLEKGDEKAVELIMGEISRLEIIVRGYEEAIERAVFKLEGDTFKEPKKL